MKKNKSTEVSPQQLTEGLPETSPEAIRDNIEAAESVGETGAGAAPEKPDSEEAHDHDNVTEKTDSTDSEIERYFGRYPSTLELLKGEKKFEITDETVTFAALTEGYARGSGVSVEEIDNSMCLLFSIAVSGRRGGFTLDQLETVMKGLSHDRRLAEVTAEAELRGRNAAIGERMPDAEELLSDGLPGISSAQATPNPQGSDSIFNLARGAR